jgi:hypothetical protein
LVDTVKGKEKVDLGAAMEGVVTTDLELPSYATCVHFRRSASSGFSLGVHPMLSL